MRNAVMVSGVKHRVFLHAAEMIRGHESDMLSSFLRKQESRHTLDARIKIPAFAGMTEERVEYAA